MILAKDRGFSFLILKGLNFSTPPTNPKNLAQKFYVKKGKKGAKYNSNFFGGTIFQYFLMRGRGPNSGFLIQTFFKAFLGVSGAQKQKGLRLKLGG